MGQDEAPNPAPWTIDLQLDAALRALVEQERAGSRSSVDIGKEATNLLADQEDRERVRSTLAWWTVRAAVHRADAAGTGDDVLHRLRAGIPRLPRPRAAAAAEAWAGAAATFELLLAPHRLAGAATAMAAADTDAAPANGAGVRGGGPDDSGAREGDPARAAADEAARFRERYLNCDAPWDAELPPPELVDLAVRTTPGHALDVGCGFGRNAVFLARLGWRVRAIDFVPEALVVAADRAGAAGVNVELARDELPDLRATEGGHELVVDVGASHNLSTEAFARYVRRLEDLVVPGGRVALFARLRDDDAETASDLHGPRGLVKAALLAAFTPGFALKSATHGRSGPPDAGWASAWFEFERREREKPT